MQIYDSKERANMAATIAAGFAAPGEGDVRRIAQLALGTLDAIIELIDE